MILLPSGQSMFRIFNFAKGRNRKISTQNTRASRFGLPNAMSLQCVFLMTCARERTAPVPKVDQLPRLGLGRSNLGPAQVLRPAQNAPRVPLNRVSQSGTERCPQVTFILPEIGFVDPKLGGASFPCSFQHQPAGRIEKTWTLNRPARAWDNCNPELAGCFTGFGLVQVRVKDLQHDHLVLPELRTCPASTSC